MIVLTTGSRGLEDPEPVFEMLMECLLVSTENFERLKIFVGDCPSGADLYTLAWAQEMIHEGHHVEYTVFEADWETWGKRAGPIRNADMVLEVLQSKKVDNEPACVVGFFQRGAGNKGTSDCVAAAERNGLKVISITV